MILFQKLTEKCSVKNTKRTLKSKKINYTYGSKLEVTFTKSVLGANIE
jgi:hypothetical protein